MRLNTAPPSSLPVKGELLPRCEMCGEVPAQGIRGGYLISGMFVCRECENTIVRLQVGTKDYEELLKKIKRLWE